MEYISPSCLRTYEVVSFIEIITESHHDPHRSDNSPVVCQLKPFAYVCSNQILSHAIVFRFMNVTIGTCSIALLHLSEEFKTG